MAENIYRDREIFSQQTHEIFRRGAENARRDAEVREQIIDSWVL